MRDEVGDLFSDRAGDDSGRHAAGNIRAVGTFLDRGHLLGGDREATCFKINDACTAIKACVDCADRLGCVWCNSLGGVGIDVGSCSAGKYDNGMECTSPLATALSERSKCPGADKMTTVNINGTNGTLAPMSSAGVQALSALVALTTVLVASL